MKKLPAIVSALYLAGCTAQAPNVSVPAIRNQSFGQEATVSVNGQVISCQTESPLRPGPVHYTVHGQNEDRTSFESYGAKLTRFGSDSHVTSGWHRTAQFKGCAFGPEYAYLRDSPVNFKACTPEEQSALAAKVSQDLNAITSVPHGDYEVRQ